MMRSINNGGNTVLHGEEFSKKRQVVSSLYQYSELSVGNIVQQAKQGVIHGSLIQDGILHLVSYYLKSFSYSKDLTSLHDGGRASLSNTTATTTVPSDSRSRT